MDAKKVRAVELLGGGMTIPKVAEELGVRRETVWKWTQDPHVSAEITMNRGNHVHKAREIIGEAVVEAVEALRRVMGDHEARDADIIKAATVILEKAGVGADKVKVTGIASKEMAGWFGE
jgi:transposase|tara:strand:+ start:460 stop:819 length:360 start_codon:yes stop_codon:yes gene_type:complete